MAALLAVERLAQRCRIWADEPGAEATGPRLRFQVQSVGELALDYLPPLAVVML